MCTNPMRGGLGVLEDLEKVTSIEAMSKIGALCGEQGGLHSPSSTLSWRWVSPAKGHNRCQWKYSD